MNDLAFVPLKTEHLNAEFETRNPEITDYFKAKAIAVEQTDFGRTYVAVKTGRASETIIRGFFVICMARIAITDLPEPPQDTHPMMPVALLAQLGKSRTEEKGFGALLLAHALNKILVISNDIGCAGIILHTNQQALQEYYREFGFIAIKRKQEHQTMFLPIKDIRNSFQSA